MKYLIWNNVRQRIYSCTILKSLTHCLPGYYLLHVTICDEIIVSVFSSRNLLILKYLAELFQWGGLATCAGLHHLTYDSLVYDFHLFFSFTFQIKKCRQTKDISKFELSHFQAQHKTLCHISYFQFEFHKMMSFSVNWFCRFELHLAFVLRNSSGRFRKKGEILLWIGPIRTSQSI